MKSKIVFLLGLAIFANIAFTANTEVVPIDKDGIRVDPGQLHTAINRWTVLATSASAGNEPNDLADVERTYTLAKAASEGGDSKIAFFDIPRNWNGIRLRAIGITEGGTATYQIYLGTLGDGNKDSDSTSANCELAYLGQFVFTVGTQVSTTTNYEMADTLVITASDWEDVPAATSPVANRVATGKVDLLGADILVAVPTTITADSKLLGKGY